MSITTVDLRTRFQGDLVEVDPDTFLADELPELVATNGALAGLGATLLGLRPLTFDVEGQPFTLAVADGGGLEVVRGGQGAVVVLLERTAFSDLVRDASSTFGLQFTGRAEVRSGTHDEFVEWEPVLRCLLDGRPVHEPGSIQFRDRDGAPLDLRRSFTLDDPREEIGHFLAEAGYLHLQGVFSDAEMAAVSAELDDAVATAEPDDGASWWVRTADGERYPARILGFNQKSPALRELLRSDRFTTIGTFTDDEFVQAAPEVGDTAEGLLKKVGVVEGASDVSWHKDCSLGGHSRSCCGLTVGLSVTGAGPANGELGAVAGSHRANVAPLGVEGLDLPRVPLPTRTGDVTVHCSCTLHMSRPPVSAQRRVVYTGFGLAPRPGDRLQEVDPEEARRRRAEQNKHSRRLQTERPGSSRSASFEL